MRLCLPIALLASACASAPCPTVDEAALRAQIRHEVRIELEREAAERRAQDRVDVTIAGEPRIRVDRAAAPTRGATEPLVTVVMFTDFQCPFCRRVVPTLEELVRRYPEDVQLVFRNNPLPFHNHALPAAEVALEAYDQGGAPLFWRMHDLLFENQRQLDGPNLEALAARGGMDVDRLRQALAASTHRPRIRADQADAARYGARGTPHFFLNGRRLSGAQPIDRFVAIVEAEVALARELLAAGVPRGELYARFVRDAVDAPPAAEPARRPTARARPDPSAVYRVPTGGRPQLGPDEALVTIVEFADFQCPFCSRVQPTLEQLRTRYGNDVRIVYRHNPLPFHQRAMPAAEASAEVFAQLGSDGFFRYTALLWENQRALEDADLVAYATQVGANGREVQRALVDGRHRASVLEDQQLTQGLGALGTPTFFVNGRNLRGAQPMAAFEAVIAEELARARAQLAAGTPRASLYDALIANGHTTAQTVSP